MAVDATAPLPTLTPDSIKRRRALAELMLKQGMDYSPIQSPWQGAARLVQGLMGGIQSGMADKAESEAQANANQLFLKAVQEGLPGSAPTAAAPATGTRSVPTFALNNGGMNYDPSLVENRQFASNDQTGSTIDEFLEGNAKAQNFGHPVFRQRLLAFLNDNPHGIGVGSLDRDVAHQAQLYANYKANGGAPVAPPGRSNHNHGVAADLSYEDANARQWAHANAPRYGLRFPMSYEPWHVEPVEARGGKAVAAALSANPPPVADRAMTAYAGVPRPQGLMAAGQSEPSTTAGGDQPGVDGVDFNAVATAASRPEVQQAAQQVAQTPAGQQMIKQAQGAPLAALMAAMSNPWISDGQKSLLLMLAKDKLDPVRNTVDLGGSIAVMDKQGNILRQIPKQRDALDDQMKRIQIEAAQKGLNAPVKIGEGDTLLDPKTYQPIATGGDKKTELQRDYAVDMKDRAARGEPPVPFGQWMETMKKAGAQGLLQTGGEVMNKHALDQFNAAQSVAMDAQKRQPLYGQMLKSMDGFSPGAGAEMRTQAKAVLKDMGLIGDIGVSDAEAFKAAQRRLEIAATPKGQGQITENERTLIREMIPQIGNSPEGIKKIVGALQRLDAYDAQVAKIWRDNSRKNGGIPNYTDVMEEISALGPPMTEAEANSFRSVQVPAANAPASSAAPVQRNGYTIKRVN